MTEQWIRVHVNNGQTDFSADLHQVQTPKVRTCKIDGLSLWRPKMKPISVAKSQLLYYDLRL